jgi:V/A-type H+/Na+-transporting ATPase subunit E
MSDKNLEQLIVSLKTEAIDAAEKKSESILEGANLRASKILQAAKAERDAIISNAEQEAQAILHNGRSALKQAGRDFVISVRNELLEIFQTVLEQETRQVFTPDLIKTVIISIIENIGSDVELKFSKEISSEMADYIHNRLKTAEKSVSIIEDNTLLSGFSITKKSQGWSYTISPEQIAEALGNHLNDNWIKILKNEASV